MPGAERDFTSLADLLRREPEVFARRRLAADGDPAAQLERDGVADGEPFEPVLANASRAIPEDVLPGLAASGPDAAPVAFLPGDAAPPEPASHAAVRSARLFRAALADALDVKLAGLLAAIADDVVARELRLGAADIAAIVRRIAVEREADGPLRLRVAPSDAGIAVDLPTAVDPSLAAGDAVLECRTGSIDARLAVRLAAVLAEFAA